MADSLAIGRDMASKVKKVVVFKGDWVVLTRGNSRFYGQAMHNKPIKERRLEIILDRDGNTMALDTSYWEVRVVGPNLIPYDEG